MLKVRHFKNGILFQEIVFSDHQVTSNFKNDMELLLTTISGIPEDVSLYNE